MNFADIKNLLEQKNELADWALRYSSKESHQLYLIGKEIENKRAVVTNRVTLTAYQDNGSQRGFSSIVLLPSESKKEIEEHIKKVAFMSGLNNNPPFSLPGSANIPKVETVDHLLLSNSSNVTEKLIDELRKALAKEEGIKLASSELYLEVEEIEQENSRGFSGASKGTCLLFDFVLIAKSGGKEAESWSATGRRRLADLKISELVIRHARHAKDTIRAASPPTGKFPVVLTRNAILPFLEPFTYHASGSAIYKKTSYFKKGEPVLNGRKVLGEKLTLSSNSLLPFGTKTNAFDLDGVSGKDSTIISDGVFLEPWATKQYADYLGIEPTGAIGNLEIPAGTTSSDEIFGGAGKRIQIVAFSALSPDSITGDFVGEIRLGYSYEKGRAQPIKGGSLSGNIFDAFTNARFSKDTVFLGNYIGPRHIRFESLTVSGG